MQLRIGELAKRTGTQVVTIRFYEKEGLLPAPERTGGNYRLYGQDALERLRFIRHCRQHGMTLPEIRDILAFSDNPTVSCEWINRLIERHIANVDAQMAELAHLKRHLESLLVKCAGDRGGHCGIIETLKAGEHCPYCENLCCGGEHGREQGGKSGGA